MEEGDEIWIDQDLGLDEDTIRRIMRILIRSAIRHEQQLTILEAKQELRALHGDEQSWNNRAANPSQPARRGIRSSSLRATLWGVILMEWQARLEKIEKDAQVLQVGGDGRLDTQRVELTVHQHAAEVYRGLDLLENNCAGKLIGLRLRKERVRKSALAKELERLQL